MWASPRDPAGAPWPPSPRDREGSGGVAVVTPGSGTSFASPNKPAGIGVPSSSAASDARLAPSSSRRCRSASISSRNISNRTFASGGASEASSDSDGVSTVSPVSPDRNPSRPPRGFGCERLRRTASASIAVRPGTPPSAVVTRAAPQDGQTSVPAGTLVEHHGQRLVAGGDSSGMDAILARRSTAPHHPEVRVDGRWYRADVIPTRWSPAVWS